MNHIERQHVEATGEPVGEEDLVFEVGESSGRDLVLHPLLQCILTSLY